MLQRTFYSAIAAIFLSVVFAQTAAAYPTTAKKSTTTVTGVYNPLNLDLTTLVNGTDALSYTPSGGALSYQVDLTGTFTGDGYLASGDAGIWTLLLSTGLDSGITASDDSSNIYMASTAAGLQVGTLTYQGGLATAGLPLDDTPQVGDFFKLFTTAAGTVLTVACHDGVTTCTDFELTQQQGLTQLGPFRLVASNDDDDDNGIPDNDDVTVEQLDRSRLNAACLDNGKPTPCGSVAGITASSVPEPATLALVGLGLVGLGLARRPRA